MLVVRPGVPAEAMRGQTFSGVEAKGVGLVDRIDPDSGLSPEYRVWGDPDTDKQKEIIECNYGFEKLETAALKRIAEP